MKLKLFSVILVLSLVLACGLALSSCVDKGNEYLNRAEINLYVQENGDVKVTERWKTEVEGDTIHNLYREIDLYDNDNRHCSVIKDFSVTNNKTGEVLAEAYNLKNPAGFDNDHLTNHSYVYNKTVVEDEVRLVEIGYYFPYTSYDELDYTMSYTITDMVMEYGDTVALYYQPFGKGFELYVDEIELNVFLPSGQKTTEDTLAFLHTELAESYCEVQEGRIAVNAGGLTEEDSLEIRALLPKTMFSGVQKTSQEAKRQAIIDEETAWIEEYEATVLKERRTTVALSIVGGVLVLLAIGLAVYFKVFYYKVSDKDGTFPAYVREIPLGVTPAEMAHFFYHYKGGLKSQKNRGNVLSATIMDLARKDFLELSSDPSDADDYVIGLCSVPDAKRAELKVHESALLELLAKVQASVGRPFNMKEFENFAKANATYTNNQINAVVGKSQKGFAISTNFKQSALSSILTTIGVLMIGGGVLFFGGEMTTYFGLGLFIAGFILEIFTPRAKKFSAEGLKKYMEAKGLERFMLDFSNLKEHEIPALILWEEYMVFATMMGISERVLEELKLRYPELTEPKGVAYTNRSYLHFYLYMNHRRVGFDLGRSLNTSLSNISRSSHAIVQAAKAQSAGGGRSGSFGRSGGGFRGGGGGFGGGGGGAR